MPVARSVNGLPSKADHRDDRRFADRPQGGSDRGRELVICVTERRDERGHGLRTDRDESVDDVLGVPIALIECWHQVPRRLGAADAPESVRDIGVDPCQVEVVIEQPLRQRFDRALVAEAGE